MPFSTTSLVSVSQLLKQPPAHTKLPGVCRHPLARILVAILFLAPVILLNNAFSFLVLDELDEPLLSAVQFPKAILFIVLLMFVYRLYCRRIEGREAPELSGAGWWREFGFGAAVGAGMVVVIVAFLSIVGSYGIESVNAPFVLVTRIFRYGQGSFVEDLLFTVILFRLLEAFGGTVAAYVLVSLLFGSLHLANDNATLISSAFISIQEIALLAPFILTRRIWMTWAVHFAWNYFQTAVFGLNNSGMAHQGFLSPVISGPAWLTGGAFGIEGSYLSLAANLAVGIPLLVLARRRGQVIGPSWRRPRDGGS